MQIIIMYYVFLQKPDFVSKVTIAFLTLRVIDPNLGARAKQMPNGNLMLCISCFVDVCNSSDQNHANFAFLHFVNWWHLKLPLLGMNILENYFSNYNKPCVL